MKQLEVMRWWVLHIVAARALPGNFAFYNQHRMAKDGVNLTERKAVHAEIANHRTNTSVFQRIYQSGVWGAFNDSAGGSGYGSLPEVAVGASRLIYHVVMMLDAHSVIDAPCGSMAWQASMVHQLHRQIPGFQFLGVDIVPEVVARNRARHPRLNFALADISDKGYSFPAGYDLIYCRDALMHLPNQLVRQVLMNMACSGAKHLLIGSEHPGKLNRDIHAGAWRPLALGRAPFNLKPSRVYYENVDDRPQLTFYLFKAQDLQQQLSISCPPSQPRDS